MSFRKLLILFNLLIAITLIAQNRLKPYEEYISKYAGIALDQQKRHGVPASITLAQGLLESGAGRSSLALRSNNHFGIKCHNTWEGDTVIFFDDGVNSCFRKYDKVEESFNDHSLFLVKGRRYATLFLLDAKDYKGWAKGLKEAGYATDPKYADKLIQLIETYQLNDLDSRKLANLSPESTPESTEKPLTRKEIKAKEKALKMSEAARIRQAQLDEKNRIAAEKKQLKATEDSIIRLEKMLKKADKKRIKAIKDSIAGTYGIFTNDVLKTAKDYKSIRVPQATQSINPRAVHAIQYLGTIPYIVAQYGDSFKSLSEEFGLSESTIRKINEFPLNYKLQSGEPVYLDTKSDWWDGEKPYHVVEKGESMHFIAQKYGLRLNSLYKMNNMTPGFPPAVGSKVKLRNPDQMSVFARALNEAFNKPDSTTTQPSIKQK